MTCTPSNLSALSYSNGFTLWHYRTDDPSADLVEEGYFNPAGKMMRPGDFIFVNASMPQWGLSEDHGIAVVTSAINGDVSINWVAAIGNAELEARA